MVSAPRVIMIGTDLDSKGGISSVLRMYEQGGLFEQVLFLPSYRDGNAGTKVSFYLGFLAKYVKALQQYPSVEVVHLHSASRGSFLRKSVALLLAKLLGKKVILHIHGAEFNEFYQQSPGLFRGVIRKLLRQADVLIALSRRWKADLEAISDHPSVRVLYNPTLLQEPNTLEDTPVNFLFMGRIGKRKGVYDIMESASLLNDAENLRIHLYGDGEVEEVREWALDKGIHHAVQVHGWIAGERKHETFQQADVLLLPSYNEGLPISVLEAMAYGMPVVATDVGGIAEAVEDGVNGFLIEPGQPSALADRMRMLALSPELRRQMGKQSHEIAQRKFALPVILNQLETLYDELLD